MATRRLPEAEAAYREALKYSEKMAAEAPSANWVQGNLALDLRLLAGVLAANQRPAEADEYLRRAILIVDKLATDFPAGPGYRRNLANAHVEHAELMKQLGRPADAEKAYRRALDLYVKLSADFPRPSTSSRRPPSISGSISASSWWRPGGHRTPWTSTARRSTFRENWRSMFPRS